MNLSKLQRQWRTGKSGMLQAMGWQRDRYNLETEQHQGLFITDCLCSATQLCLTLCNSMDCSPPDTSVHGIFQARILEQVAISYSRGKELFGSTIFSKSVKSVKVLVTQSCPPPQRGTSVHGILQARVLEWSPFPSPGDLPDPGTELRSPAMQADSLSPTHQGSPFSKNSPSKWMWFLNVLDKQPSRGNREPGLSGDAGPTYISV